MIHKKQSNQKPVIDLSGPDGNAFAIMGYAKQFGNQLGYSDEETAEMINDMMSGDYKHLLQVFENNFGAYVKLER